MALEEMEEGSRKRGLAMNKEVQRNMRVAMEYLRFGHDEAAADALFPLLKQVENPLFLILFLVPVLQILYRLERLSEILEIYETHKEVVRTIQEAAVITANAFLQEGGREEAVALFRGLSEAYPHPLCLNEEEREAVVPRDGEERELLERGLSLGVSPYLFFEYILPVISGIRKVTCSFLDELLFGLQGKDGSNLLEQAAADLYTTFGVRLFFSNWIHDVGGYIQHSPKVYYFMEPGLLLTLMAMQENALEEISRTSEEPARWSEKWFREEGVLLGYPECCISTSVYRRYRHGKYSNDMEREASLDLIPELYRDGKWLFPAYAFFEFYPCEPGCLSAGRKGLQLLEGYEAWGEKAVQAGIQLVGTHVRKILDWQGAILPAEYIIQASRELARLYHLEWKPPHKENNEEQ